MDMEFLETPIKLSGLDPITYQYFNQLLNHRTIILNDDICENIVEMVIAPLKNFEQDNSVETVNLWINTAGGSVADGLVACNIIDNYSKKLNIYILGYSCSMGTIMMCAGNHNPNVTKYCYDFSFGLFHGGSTFVGGESTSVDDVIDFNRRIEARIKDYIISNTNITEDLYDKHHRKQWYIDAKEMLEFGLVDKIIGSDENA